MRRNPYKTLFQKLILLASLLLHPIAVFAQSPNPGDLDLSFGKGGIVTMTTDRPYHLRSREMLVQPDGKILVWGWILDGDDQFYSVFLARYDPTGAIDASFGTNGKITPYPFEAQGGFALQPDGKIIAVGFGQGFDTDSRFASGWAVSRYNANGTPDASFGTGGVVIFTHLEDIYTESLAVQADGKIVVVGYRYQPNYYGIDLTVLRLQPDGSLDTSFNGTGIVTTSFGNNSYASKVVLQPDGKIVAVGAVRKPGFGDVGNNAVLVRYNVDGSLDSGFGVDGKVIHTISFNSVFVDAVLQPDGKIVASGYFTESFGSAFVTAIVRYNPNGSIDTNFAANGIFTTDAYFYVGNGIALQSDGKLVAFGTAGESASSSLGGLGFAVARLNPNGTWDTSFGDNGRVSTPINAEVYTRATDGAVQPDGKILAFGESFTYEGDPDIAIARYDGGSAACVNLNPIDCPDFSSFASNISISSVASRMRQASRIGWLRYRVAQTEGLVNSIILTAIASTCRPALCSRMNFKDAAIGSCDLGTLV